MGFLRTLTKSAEGIILLLLIGTALVFFIVYIFAGDWLLETMGKVLLQSIIPGVIMVFGLFLGYSVGFKQKKTQFIFIGFAVFIFGFVLAVIMGAF